MRLGILIRDAEYRDALIDKLSTYDKDLFVNIIGKSGGDSSDCLILTDIRPDEVDKAVLSKISPRTVFLSTSAADGEDTSEAIRRVFKYSSVNDLLSEISLAYNEWRGNLSMRSSSARIIAVCSETDHISADRAASFARQVIYRQGGKVLLMSLGYINDHGRSGNDKTNRFARLMYAIRTGRHSASDSFTYTDSYGVSVLMIPEGMNPVAYLAEEELKSVIRGLSGCFDTIVLDIGTCYREENRKIMSEADGIVCFVSGSRYPGLADSISELSPGRAYAVRLTGETDEALAIDDCIGKIYGKENTWERQEPAQ